MKSVNLGNNFPRIPRQPGEEKGKPQEFISPNELKGKQLSFLDPSLEQEIRSILAQFSHYVETLPLELRSLTETTSLWKERGIGLSHYLPFWLNREFCEGALLTQASQMALANRFGQIYCLIQDGVIDQHVGTEPRVLILLNALFYKFLHGYQELFPASHSFWSYFETYWNEYLQALAWEKTHHQGRIAAFTEEDFLWLGRKFAPVKICCAGMALLAGREEEIPCLSNHIEHVQTGCQLLDDLKDWAEDLNNKDYTYPLTLAYLHGQNEQSPLEIEKLLWSKGLVLEVFQKAIDLFDLSFQDISHLSLRVLKRWVRKIQEETWEKMEKIPKVRELNEKRAKLPQLEFFSQKDQYIVFNVSSSFLYQVDHESVSLLKRMSRGALEGKTIGAEELLGELQETGVLTLLPEPEGEETPALTSLALNISSHCNLACSYCFANRGKYNAGDNQDKSMSTEVGEAAIDLLLKESRDQAKVKILFFGGEPLLNSELITHLLDYGRRRSLQQGKVMQFSVVTNGMQMPQAMIDLFSREKVSVSVSLDGPPEVQNRQRPTMGGEETYKTVVENIRRLKNSGVKQTTIHATICSHTPSPAEVLDHLLSLEPASIQMEYLHPTQDRRTTWSESELPIVKKSQVELADYFLSHLRQGRIIPFANMLKPLIRIYRRERFLYRCAAGVSSASVSREGNIFPCFRFFEIPGAVIGNVFSGLHRQKMGPYIQDRVERKETCQSCWARYLCGGNCPYDNLLLTGDISRPHPQQCALIKHHFEVIIRLFASIVPELPSLREKIEALEGLSIPLELLRCNR